MLDHDLRVLEQRQREKVIRKRRITKIVGWFVLADVTLSSTFIFTTMTVPPVLQVVATLVLVPLWLALLGWSAYALHRFIDGY